MKKDELQYLAGLCKAEVESAGRMTAGALRILKLDQSVGSAAIHQLSNLGNEITRVPFILITISLIFIE